MQELLCWTWHCTPASLASMRGSVLGQGAASLWFLLRESTVLLLSMRAKPTSDQQARALACTFVSSGAISQPHLAVYSPSTQQSRFPKAVNVEAAKHLTS